MKPLWCMNALILLFAFISVDAKSKENQSNHEMTSKIVIIIDDIGYKRNEGELMARFPASITLAVLPQAPHSQHLASMATEHGKELLLHAPMSAQGNPPLDQGALTNEMNYATFIKTLRQNLDYLPSVIGVNNHMGSALTENTRSMRWLMTELKRRELIFIDSRTTAATVAKREANTHRVPALERHVFLDNQATTEFVEQQFDTLITEAKTRGFAIGIGHPHQATITVLQKEIPRLTANGIELISLSQAIKHYAK